MVNSSRGRPRGGSDARQRLLTAAEQLFLESGYENVSGRAIARKAGVDHTLVNYYFGSKQGLFGEVMRLALTPSMVIGHTFKAGSMTARQRADLLLTNVLTVWEQTDVRTPFVSMITRALTDDALRQVVAGFLETEVNGAVARQLTGRHAQRRATAVATLIAGIVMSRYVMRIDPLASMSPRDVVATFAPMVALTLQD